MVVVIKCMLAWNGSICYCIRNQLQQRGVLVMDQTDIDAKINIHVTLYLNFILRPWQLHVALKQIPGISLYIMAGQEQLWEIDDVFLNKNYSSQDSEYGVNYSLTTSRADLPAGFYAFER